MHRLAMLVPALLMCLVLPLKADSTLEKRFLWEEATLKMSSARTHEDFAAAAAVYLKLANSGVRNGPLFYNLGTAYLLAGRHEAAKRHLFRAERYMGSDWDVRHNLLIAGAGRNRKEDVALPWHRALFHWHYRLSTPVRSAVASCAFGLFWLAMTAATLGFRRSAKPFSIAFAVVVIVFTSSVATSLYQEFSAGNQSDSLPRAGNAAPGTGAGTQKMGDAK